MITNLLISEGFKKRKIYIKTVVKRTKPKQCDIAITLTQNMFTSNVYVKLI